METFTIQGKLDMQKLFDTVAIIISKRENVKITVTIKERG
jgi:hypothetical protein